MEKLYASGDGILFLQSLEWLSSEKDSLKTLGTLAIGNFARRGKNSNYITFENLSIRYSICFG